MPFRHQSCCPQSGCCTSPSVLHYMCELWSTLSSGAATQAAPTKHDMPVAGRERPTGWLERRPFLPSLQAAALPSAGSMQSAELWCHSNSERAFSTISRFSNMPAGDTPARAEAGAVAGQWGSSRQTCGHGNRRDAECRRGAQVHVAAAQSSCTGHLNHPSPLDCKKALSCATDMCCTSSRVGGVSGSTLQEPSGCRGGWLQCRSMASALVTVAMQGGPRNNAAPSVLCCAVLCRGCQRCKCAQATC